MKRKKEHSKLDDIQNNFLASVFQKSKLENFSGPKKAIEIYQKGYVGRLTEALGATFEAVWWVLGDEDFFKAGEDFIALNNSHTYNLSDYGETFPSHLKTRAPEFLSELARFEWEFKELFYSKANREVQPFEAVGLDARFYTDETAIFFESEYSVYEIWKARGKSKDIYNSINWNKTQSLVLYKRAEEIFAEILNETKIKILNLIKAGASLGEISEQMTEKELTPAEVSEFFQFLIQSQLITGVNNQR